MVNDSVLVLNRSWVAINVANSRRAISLLYQGHAEVVSTDDFATYNFDDWLALSEDTTLCDETRVIRSINLALRIPEVIVLRAFNGYFKREIPLSRRALLERDHQTCQYCRKGCSRTELTIDHVMPRSKGGRHTWTNVVLACTKCNVRKGNRTPEEAGMPLLKRPRKPDWLPHVNATYLGTRKPSWHKFVRHGSPAAALGGE